MVSLKSKLSYLDEFKDKPKILSFIELINGEKNIGMSDSSNDTDKTYFDLIKSLSSNSKSEFERVYVEFSRRKPSDESPWLYNDFLIFVLLIGVQKFNLDKAWLLEVLNLRQNSNETFHNINRTFKNLLSGNLNSTDNLNEIVIVYLNLLNQEQLSKQLLDSTYLKLSAQKDLLTNHNDFITVMAFRSYDVIVITKDTPDATEIVGLKSFRDLFIRRVNIVGDLIYYGIIIFILYKVLYYYRTYEDFKDYVDDIGAIYQIAGFALIIFFKWARRGVKSFLFKILGYSKYFKQYSNEGY